MANLREIKARIDSVKSTMQVTRTMEMISTAKIRRALERAQEAEPYKEAITRMLSHVAGASAHSDEPLLQSHEAEANARDVVGMEVRKPALRLFLAGV